MEKGNDRPPVDVPREKVIAKSTSPVLFSVKCSMWISLREILRYCFTSGSGLIGDGLRGPFTTTLTQPNVWFTDWLVKSCV